MIHKRDETTVTFLRSVPVFQDLRRVSLQLLLDFLDEQEFGNGETIFSEGERGRTMYVIREGEVEVRRRSSDGKDVTIVTLGPGETFGEMTLVELEPRSATIVAKRKTLVYSLTNLDLWNLYKADNYAYVIILQNICRMVSRRLRKADSRIADFLVLTGQEKGKRGAAKRKR